MDDLADMRVEIERRLGLLAEPGAAEVIASGARIVLLPPDPPPHLQAQLEERRSWWPRWTQLPAAFIVQR